MPKQTKTTKYFLKSISSASQTLNPSKAFTIVELLVVIVVIGILASITIVSYIGVVQKTKVASLKADLSTSAQRIKLFQVDNDFYPHQINDCPSPATTNLCLTPSNNSTYDYTVNNSTNPQSFTLIATADDGITKYQITEGGGITEVAMAPASNSFAVAWGGAGDDLAHSVVQTSDGGYAIAGDTDSFGAYDAFIAKYANDGSLSWSRTWGGADFGSALSIVQTNDGGYATAGVTASHSASDSSAYIAKYTSDGTLSWSRTWDGSGDDYAESIAQTSDGGYVMAGETKSYGAGNDDAFLAKYTPDGTLSWSRTWGGVDYDAASLAIQTTDGGYVMAGETESYGAGNNDAFLAKYTSDGTLSWSRTWGGDYMDGARSLIQTADGGYAVVGEMDISGGGDYGAAIVKYTSDGTLSWNRIWNGSGQDYAESIIQASDGGYVISGITNSYGAGGFDTFLVKYTSDGMLSWSRTWGGSGRDYSESLVYTSDGGYAVAGYAVSYGAGNYDAFLVKYFADGTINGCISPMCQVPIPSVLSPTATVLSPTAAVTAPTATTTSVTTSTFPQSATYTVMIEP